MTSYPAFQVSPEEAAKGKWYIATAATNHMTHDKNLISDLKPITDGRNIIADGNGAGLKVQGRGAVNTDTVVLPSDVWYVPEINENLVSVGQLTELGLDISIGRGVCTITRGSDGSVVGKAHRSGAVYEVEFLKHFLSSPPRAHARAAASHSRRLALATATATFAISSEMASYPVFQVSPEEAAKGKWYMATTATNHMTCDQSLISNLKPVTSRVVGGGNSAGLKVHGSGAVNTEMVVIPDVWHVPGINANLISVAQLSLLGLNISFGRGVCTVTRGSDGSVVGKAHRSGAVYEVEFLKDAGYVAAYDHEHRTEEMLTMSPEEAAKGKWYIATAAMNHMTRDRSVVSDFRPVRDGLIIPDGNGAGLPMHGIGAVDTGTVVIPDVWYVPGINCNLISVKQITELGHVVSLSGDGCTITRYNDRSFVVGKAHISCDGILPYASIAPSSSEIMAPRKRSHLRRKPEERANVNSIFISSEPEGTNPKWFITAAATNHMTSDKSIFSDLKPMAGLVIGDRAGAGAGLPMHGIGAVETWEVVLPDVWYVPGIHFSLVSAGQLTANGLKTEIAGDVCTVARADGSVVGKGRLIRGGIYEVDFLRV
uniref:Retrovirus-related Pol polyprotein from transposon TNT 1-94-like beta-barrel domain-containing protein n=1 Tax=Oryza punctata TaxID=4537 RepID=A0A0E0MI57_ORYPU